MMSHEIRHSEQIGFPILTILIALPLVWIALLALVHTSRHIYRLALAGAGAELALSALVLKYFRPGVPDLQFAEHIRLTSIFGYHVGVDGISVLFIPFTALLTVLVTLYAQHVKKADPAHYMMAVFGIESTLMGTFCSVDLLMLWLFFVLELVPSYFLIVHWGTGPRRVEVGKRYIAAAALGAILMLFGLCWLGYAAAAPGGQGQAMSFDLPSLLAAPVPARDQNPIFLVLCLALAMRIPLFPFHTWLPVVMQEGPVVGVNLFLVGVKIGSYTFLRFIIPLLPHAAHSFWWLMPLLALTGTAYSSLLALAETNLRRFIAFACLAQTGSIMAGVFSLNADGFRGGLLQMFNLGIAAAGFYFVAGFLYVRAGSAELSELSGLSHRLPVFGLTFLAIALATIGMPLTSGFDAEHLVMSGAIHGGHWPVALAVGLGTLIQAAVLLWYYQRAFLVSADQAVQAKLVELRAPEMAIVGSLAVMIFGLNIFAHPIEHLMSGSIGALDARMQDSRHDARQGKAGEP
jgi:NADH-quinone oxidoreductase subunit M